MTREEALEAACLAWEWAHHEPRWSPDDARRKAALEKTLAALAMPKDEALLEQRTIGHGEGQAHAIADVNAGRVDDLIRARLLRVAEAAWERGFRCHVSNRHISDDDAKALRISDLAKIVEGVK